MRGRILQNGLTFLSENLKDYSYYDPLRRFEGFVDVLRYLQNVSKFEGLSSFYMYIKHMHSYKRSSQRIFKDLDILIEPSTTFCF